MWGKGVQMKYHRNTYLKAFTCGEKTVFKHLNKIWSKTKAERDAIIRAQIYMHHSSDNCQEYHAFATQRRNQPGVMHTGMVFNLMQAKECEKPPGTVMKDPDGNEWVVVSSRLQDYWRCDMKLLRETFDGDAFSISKQYITFPLVGWNIVRLPNEPKMPSLTYIDQQIRPSLRMTISCEWDDVSIVMDRRNSNAPKQRTSYLAPDRYHELVLVTHRMNDLFSHVKREMSANILEQSEQDGNVSGASNHTAYKSTFAYMKRWPAKVKRISNFQKQMVREWMFYGVDPILEFRAE